MNNERILRNDRGWRIGESNAKAKLTDEQVRKMRRMYRPHLVGYVVLAETFGCGESTVRDIVKGRTRASA